MDASIAKKIKSESSENKWLNNVFLMIESKAKMGDSSLALGGPFEKGKLKKSDVKILESKGYECEYFYDEGTKNINTLVISW